MTSINPRKAIRLYFPYLLIPLFFTLFSACTGNDNSKTKQKNNLFTKGINKEDINITIPLQVGLQTIKIDSIPIDISVPEGTIIGDLLILPGWNFSKERWCTDSDLCTKALAKGYRLIMPEMGLSVYATHYFPQTRDDWRTAPTGLWLTDTLIPYIQHFFGILLPDKKNYIIGLSTGGRGVVMTALRTINLFSAGASLSGDFDQAQTPYDAVMSGFYGTYDENRDLWQNFDNPSHEAAFLKVPLYLAHGLNDPIVPYEQTQSFYNTLSEVNPKLQVILHLSPTGGHDFYFWNSEIDAALKFFSEH